jgi:hypothetical protein
VRLVGDDRPGHRSHVVRRRGRRFRLRAVRSVHESVMLCAGTEASWPSSRRETSETVSSSVPVCWRRPVGTSGRLFGSEAGGPIERLRR